MAPLSSFIPQPNRAGWPFIGGFAAASLFFFVFWPTLGVIGFFLTAWCVAFFRDPARVTPSGDGLVVSPADGLIIAIGEVTPPAEMDLGKKAMTRISIFMSVFDVHVNRVPADGIIRKLHYYPGTFVNASLDKASEQNERMAITMETTVGKKKIGFVQIAGLIARRILCQVEADQHVQAGERFGMIRFGSRMDVYLPHGIAPRVLVGQRAVAGETVLAHLSGEQTTLEGEAR